MDPDFWHRRWRKNDSVEEPEVQALYETAYDIERLYVYDAPRENPRFHDRLSRLEEKVYLLKPK